VTKTPRLIQIEAMLADDPSDAFLRYGQALEYASGGDDATAADLLQQLIALGGDAPYIPAFLMAGQTYARLGEEGKAAAVLTAGIAAATRANTPQSLHAMGEMQGLLATVE
jgi:predicted Zn-dependent protease